MNRHRPSTARDSSMSHYMTSNVQIFHFSKFRNHLIFISSLTTPNPNQGSPQQHRTLRKKEPKKQQSVSIWNNTGFKRNAIPSASSDLGGNASNSTSSVYEYHKRQKRIVKYVYESSFCQR